LVGGIASHRAQSFDRFGQGKLFADKTLDKASAADFTARLQPAVNPKQSAP
jgi:hypothetical protein